MRNAVAARPALSLAVLVMLLNAGLVLPAARLVLNAGMLIGLQWYHSYDAVFVTPYTGCIIADKVYMGGGVDCPAHLGTLQTAEAPWQLEDGDVLYVPIGLIPSFVSFMLPLQSSIVIISGSERFGLVHPVELDEQIAADLQSAYNAHRRATFAGNAASTWASNAASALAARAFEASASASERNTASASSACSLS